MKNEKCIFLFQTLFFRDLYDKSREKKFEHKIFTFHFSSRTHKKFRTARWYTWHFAKASTLANQGKMTKRNTFHSIFWLQLPDFAKYRLEHVWMVFDSRNASEMRLGRILSITSIIQVPWTRITSTKVYFQGSGKMLRNTLLLQHSNGTGVTARTLHFVDRKSIQRTNCPANIVIQHCVMR